MASMQLNLLSDDAILDIKKIQKKKGESIGLAKTGRHSGLRTRRDGQHFFLKLLLHATDAYPTTFAKCHSNDPHTSKLNAPAETAKIVNNLLRFGTAMHPF